MIHELKILPQYFNAVVNGEKTFEVRKNDRDFKLGDYVLLKEFYPVAKKITKNKIMTRITYVLNDPEYCKEGYVIFGIEVLG